MRKICVVSATRAEWYLLENLCDEVRKDKALRLQLIITGTHLSPEFKLTYKEIEQKFTIDKKIEMLLSSDSEVGICKSMGLAFISICEALMDLKPDVIVLLGDRYEMLAFATCALICKIPIAHLHGGEASFGAVDEAFRHSITKMSHLHFVANENYAKRVIQLGENPDKVFTVGGFGVDNIAKLKLLSKKELEKALNFKFQKRNFLITFHPETLEKQSFKKQCDALLKALEKQLLRQDCGLIFTYANADTNGRIINALLDDFVQRHKNTAVFASMGALYYLNAMRFVNGVVGNSSSGICEAPSFKIATINIGGRQNGRLKAKSVIDCEAEFKAICKAFERLEEESFQKELKTVKNPYGEAGAAKKTKEILKKAQLSNIVKKQFFDLDFKVKK